MKSKMLMISIVIVLLINNLQAQDKFMTRNGHVKFYSETPMEKIEANNNEAGSVLNTSTGDVTVALLNKSFKFERSLMEEHFNENYMQSDKFPKSTFKGKITDLKNVDFKKNGKYKVKVEGTLNAHGKDKAITADATIEVDGTKINATSVFNITPGDIGIEIPKLVKDKIAKTVQVTIEFKYEPAKKN